MHRTEYLTGLTLDQAVAKAQELEVLYHPIRGILCIGTRPETLAQGLVLFCPSRRWEDAGPIITKERIELKPMPQISRYGSIVSSWEAYIKHPGQPTKQAYGDTALVAAMRAYCLDQFGEYVELPILRNFQVLPPIHPHPQP